MRARGSGGLGEVGRGGGRRCRARWHCSTTFVGTARASGSQVHGSPFVPVLAHLVSLGPDAVSSRADIRVLHSWPLRTPINPKHTHKALGRWLQGKNKD